MHPAALAIGVLLGDATGPVPRGVVLAGGALIGGYVVGCVPVAWLLVRRAERQRRVERLPAASGTGMPPPLRIPGRRRPGTLEAFAAGGIRVALLTVALELIKGAVVGLGARLYDDSSWFAAYAIAGCVVGDAFPLGIRRGRRGIAPLVSGVWAALPGAWATGVIVAIPAVIVLAIGGVAFDVVLAVCVPLAFVLGTHDALTLIPAALIVVALVARSRLRRRQRQATVDEFTRLGGGPGTIEVTAPPRH